MSLNKKESFDRFIHSMLVPKTLEYLLDTYQILNIAVICLSFICKSGIYVHVHKQRFAKYIIKNEIVSFI